MDYKKVYNNTYNSSRTKWKNFIKTQLQKGRDDGYSFETIFEEVSNTLYQTKNEHKRTIKDYSFKEVINEFDAWREKYTQLKRIEHIINNELYTLYHDQTKRENLDINFSQFLMLIAKYRAAVDTIVNYYERKVYTEITFEANMLEAFTLEPHKNKWEDSKEYTKFQAKLYGKTLDKSTKGEWQDSIWKDKIALFTNDEKILLLTLYYEKREKIKRPEFLKLIMITGGLNDSSIFEDDYRNKKLYKQFSEGIGYLNFDKTEFLKNLIKKVRPFNMKTIYDALLLLG